MPVRIYAIVLMLMTLFLSACGLLHEPEEARGPMEAFPLAEVTETSQGVEAVSEESASAPPALQEATPLAATPTTDVEPAPEAATPRLYETRQADSEVRFELEEDLRGQRVLVVGLSDQLAGQIAVDLDDLSSLRVGVVQVPNAANVDEEVVLVINFVAAAA